MYFIGIDSGLSNIKITLIDLHGNELMVFRHNCVYEVDDGIYKQQDLKNVIEKITGSLVEIKNKKPKEFDSINSIAVSTNGATFVLLDKKMKELTSGISVFDRRASIENRTINSLINPLQNYLISGHKDHTDIYPDSKILWYKNNRKEIFSKIDKVLFLQDYINYKLAGITVADRSIASISGMYDINKNCWREDILDILGLKEKNFSEVIDGGQVIGKITPEFAEKTGLNKNVTVVSGLLDALSNTVGTGNIKFKDAVECTGTVLSLIVNTPEPKFNKIRIPVNYFINNTYSLLPYSPTAGILIDWFGTNFYNNKNYFKLMEKDVSAAKPEEEGIILIPYLTDTSIIHGNIKSSGLFFGFRLNHKKPQFARSIYESIGFILKENLLSVEKIINFKIRSIFSVGGASKNRTLGQIKSDITGKNIITIKNKEVGCLGVSILAAVANRFYKNIEEACKKMVKIENIYKPDQEAKSIYDKKFLKYLDIFKSANKLFLKYCQK